MQCDICGKEAQLYRTKIEDSFLNACKECSGHGKVMEKVVPKTQGSSSIEITTPIRREITQIIRKDFPIIVKNAREKTGLKQKEIAQKIAEKESVIHQIESGNFKPSIKLARKLEKFLNITLVESYQEEGNKSYGKTKNEGFTIADMIKIKKN